jgi:large subunit ribosomal protein L23
MVSEWHPGDIIKFPIISEKSMDDAEKGKYIFIVSAHSTKAEIRRAISDLYGVDVVKVNIVNLPRKPKHYGRHEFQTGTIRKAIVTLTEGQNIPEITEAV